MAALARVALSAQGHVMTRLTPARRSKYGAQRTTVSGLSFASKAEARRYAELVLLQKAGEIDKLATQPSYPLYAARLPSGDLEAVGHYRADFKYWDRVTQQWIVEDVKGMRTLPLSAWKMKHLRLQEGIEVREIRNSR